MSIITCGQPVCFEATGRGMVMVGSAGLNIALALAKDVVGVTLGMSCMAAMVLHHNDGAIES